MEVLTRQRGIVKGKLTSISKFLNTLQEPNASVSLTLVNARTDKLEEIWNEYNKIQNEIQMVCEQEQVDIQQNEREDFENKFFNIKSSLTDWIASQSTTPHSFQRSNSQAPSQVKLPKLDLPTFSGNYTDWIAFYDLFRVLVHDNSSLGDVQKLQYLKGCLKGEASRLINALQVTDANYLEAWKLLKERYDHKRQIIAAHYKAILSQPALHKDSGIGLRQLLDIYLENMRSLSVLKADDWDHIMVHLFSERMDNETRRLWEMSITGNEPSTFNELKTFVQQRCQALEITRVDRNKTEQTHRSNTEIKSRATTSCYASAVNTCVICNSSHSIQQCETFLKTTPEQRVTMVKIHKLCFNCLKEGHSSQRCKSGGCRKCGKTHHTLLHYNKQAHVTTPTPTERVASEKGISDTSPMIVSHITNQTTHPLVLLSTLVVNVQDEWGERYLCRALLDSGSQGNFITESLVQRLKIKKSHEKVAVRGIGMSGLTQSCGMVNLRVSSTTSNFELDITAVVLPRITSDLPSKPVNTNNWKHLCDIKLADPNYYKPGKVDLLLGADVFARSIGCGKILGAVGQPSAQSTEFGWIICGTCSDNDQHTVSSHLVVTTLEVEKQLKLFWELEEVKPTPAFSLEEKQCEAFYSATTTRNENGRYVVELPFKEHVERLGESRTQALSRLKQMEKRLDRYPERKLQYVQFMREYQELDHMELVSHEEINKPDNQVYYLPHHAVYKETSSTTKLRVVFDASSPTSSGISLNDRLIVGPTLQEDLVSILLRFRKHRFVFTADVAKMFRQIQVHSNHQDFQRILWRESPELPIKTYKLKTVTYGTASAPYLAVRTLRQVASDEAVNFPSAAKVVSEDFYIDDCMTGTDSMQQTVNLREDLTTLLERGGFQLHKWASNCAEVIAPIPENQRECNSPLNLDLNSLEETVKTLGIIWHPNSDTLSFRIPTSRELRMCKRNLLSEISRIFDPLGWISPVVIVAKILLQRVWLCGLSWDDELPDTIVRQWQEIKEQLPALNDLKIPRYLGTSSIENQQVHLHGFSDASESAYGAVIYVRVITDNGETFVNLLCSKTKVAPLKKISIPRLELCAAVLLVRLVNFVIRALRLKFETVTAWTDSSVVLAWIRGHPNKWKTFVANRVSEIQDVVPPEHWFHVKTKENPADCASRGLTPQELLNKSLWWTGPDWLSSVSVHDLPKCSTSSDEPEVLVEQRLSKTVCLVTTSHDNDILLRFSKLGRLVRITALLLRFVHNCKAKQHEKLCGFLTTQELKKGLLIWVKKAQSEVFGRECNDLNNSDTIQANSKLNSLCPFLDSQGFLRVGGRLENSDLNFDQKHPLLLPRKHVVTDLIITHEHVKHLHAGPTLLLSILRRSFWIVNARDCIRRNIHKCITCFRQKATVSAQLMGQLPTHRVQQSRPFLCCGVDYAGPLTIRATTGRGRVREEKCYVALFICFATKAIHLELVTSLSTEAFIGALRRFVARRGKCNEIYSDCGTNFIGADQEIKKLLSFVKNEKHNQQIGELLASEDINWHFNPPAAPHFGGLWEAGVKSAKYHLRRVVGNNALTFEQLYTVLTQIEACLNSRPLCPLSSDPNDLTVLTPGHFLIGDSLVSVPDPDLSHLKANTLSKWQHLQKMKRDFWKRWSLEYVTTLQQRQRWMHKNSNLQIGDMILLKDENLPPLKWKLGRVTATHPGKDGLVRTVTIKTVSGFLKRPIVKLCRLPID